ncbi:hypothetical protein ACQP1P_35405 [Dactylosporangium sp. CA-052675]|uniref:hypothetical protein n=1 Tax=Dactylosporangium sp. CA-052675 TaxID=3239927 RepID=UPI003D8F805D
MMIVLLAIVGATAVAGCSNAGLGEVLASSKTLAYGSPVWIGDAIYFLQYSANDSSGGVSAMKMRPGEPAEAVTVQSPDCRRPAEERPSINALVAMSDHELGLVMSCGNSLEPNRSAFVRKDIRGKEQTTVTPIDFGGWGAAWSASSDSVYSRVESCPSQGMKAVGKTSSECVGGADVRFPAVTESGTLFFLANQCGTERAGPPTTYAVCRYDGAGRITSLALGVRDPWALTVSGDRIVVAGKVNGSSGLWSLEDGLFRSLAKGDYRGGAFTPDGKRLAATLRDDGWFSTRWSLRLISVP